VTVGSLGRHREEGQGQREKAPKGSETVVANLLAQVSELVAILKVCVRKLRGQ